MTKGATSELDAVRLAKRKRDRALVELRTAEAEYADALRAYEDILNHIIENFAGKP